MIPQLRLSLLGSPQVTVDDEPLTLTSRKALALLYYLAVTSEGHMRDHLATLLWPEQDQTQARASLRHVLWLLKQAGLADWLNADTDHIACHDSIWCDVRHFRQATAAGDHAAALDLYRGDFLTGFTLRDCPDFDHWQFTQADELNRLLGGALQALADSSAAAGDYDAALAHAQRLLALDPLVEDGHRRLMRLHALAGQHALALRQYEECARILDAELGVPPDADTQALYQQIKSRQIQPPRQDKRPRAILPPAAQPPALAVTHKLPAELTPCIGRDAETAELVARLTDPSVRLVTLTGPGGVGKTRLAIHVAHRLHEAGHPVALIDLQAVAAPTQLTAAIVGGLGLPHNEEADPLRQLQRALADDEWILVLDNFEHLIDDAELLTRIQEAAPGLTLLVTSRTVLNLPQEWTYPLDGLAFPQGERFALEDFAAVRLFTACALRVRSSFQLSQEQDGVAAICRLVDGLPLALELAASWARTLTAQEIADEIARDLAFLATPARSAGARHQSLQVVFDYSWQILKPAQREVFRRLAFFRGGFDRAAAQAIAGASLPVLTALVDQSLLHRRHDGRYAIHELLRQFAAAKLAENPAELAAVQDRYRDDYLRRFRRLEVALRSSEQAQALQAMQSDLPNLLAAWEQALAAGDWETLAVAVVVFWRYYWLRNQGQEGRRLLTQALDQIETVAHPVRRVDRDKIRLTIYNTRGHFHYFLGDFAAAHADFHNNLQLAQALALPIEEGYAWEGLGVLARWQGDPAAAVAAFDEALRLFRAAGHRDGEADVLEEVAQMHSHAGRFDEARRCAEESLHISRALGRPDWTAWALDALGWAEFCTGNYTAANACYMESYDHFELVGHQLGMALALGGQGMVIWATAPERLADAFALFERSLNICRRIEHRSHEATRLIMLAHICNDAEEYDRAASYAEAGLVLARTLQSPFSQMGSLCCLAEAAYFQGDFVRSHHFLNQACTLAVDAQLHPQLLIALFHCATALIIESEMSFAGEQTQQQQVTAIEILLRLREQSALWAIYRERTAKRLAELTQKWPKTTYLAAQQRSHSRSFDEMMAALLADALIYA